MLATERPAPKVVKLSAGLSPEQRQERVGKVSAKACNNFIQQMKAGLLAAAAKQCVKMFEQTAAVSTRSSRK